MEKVEGERRLPDPLALPAWSEPRGGATKPLDSLDFLARTISARAPERQSARAPERQSARAPERQSARAPERQSARAPERQSARAPERQSARAPERRSVQGAMSPPAGAWGASSDGSSPPSVASASCRPGPRPPERLPGGDGRPTPPPSRFRAFRLARRLGAAACLLAAGLALLLGAGAAEAQTPTSKKLVSNTGVTTTHNLRPFNNDHAQAFTTGGSLYGYKLTRVELRIQDTLGTGLTRPTYSVSIQRPLGTVLGTLKNPASLPNTVATVSQFTAPGTGIDLAPNTQYFVVIDVTANPSSNVSVFRILSGNEDPGGEAGWSIGDSSRVKFWNGTSWTGSSFVKHLAVHGYAKDAPLSGRTLTINLDRAIDPTKCPLPGAFSLYAYGVKQPHLFSSVRCKANSLVLVLSKHYTDGNSHLRVTPPIPAGLAVEVRYDKSKAQASAPTAEGATTEVDVGQPLAYADDGTEVPNFTEPVHNQTPGPRVGPDLRQRVGQREDADAHLRRAAGRGLGAGGRCVPGVDAARRRARPGAMRRVPDRGDGCVGIRRHGGADPGPGDPRTRRERVGGVRGAVRQPAAGRVGQPQERAGEELRRMGYDRAHAGHGAGVLLGVGIGGRRCRSTSTSRWTRTWRRRAAPSR